MSPDQRRAWEQVRARGRGRFILVFGVLFWGTLMFVFSTFVSRLWRSELTPLTVAEVLLQAAVWALAGVVFGAALWAWTERRWRRAQQFRDI